MIILYRRLISIVSDFYHNLEISVFEKPNRVWFHHEESKCSPVFHADSCFIPCRMWRSQEDFDKSNLEQQIADLEESQELTNQTISEMEQTITAQQNENDDLRESLK